MSRKSTFNGEALNLVFSDEFNNNNRTFYPGDDPFWTAPNIWYGATQDMEWYGELKGSFTFHFCGGGFEVGNGGEREKRGGARGCGFLACIGARQHLKILQESSNSNLAPISISQNTNKPPRPRRRHHR